MTPAAILRFNRQAAKQRRTLNPAKIRRVVDGVATGGFFTVTLSAVRVERELLENGFVTLHKAQLRVLKTIAWQPAEGDEFVNVDTDEVFRCNSATGSSSPTQAEIVCDVVKICDE